MEFEFHSGIGRFRRRGMAARPARALRPAAWVERLEGRVLLSTAITALPIPSAGSIGPLTLGSDGNLWYGRTEWSGGILNLPVSGRVGRMTPTGAVTEYPLPSGGYPVSRLTAGPDGNLWFIETVNHDGPTTSSLIGRVTPSGAISEYPLPTGVTPTSDLTVGPDGNLWFAETIQNPGGLSTSGRVGRVTPSGVVTEYPIPSGGSASDLTVGPDGNLWFTETVYVASGSPTSGRVGRVTPSGVVSEYPLPSAGFLSNLTVGPDGNLWFTRTIPSRSGLPLQSLVGRVTPSGAVSEYPLPSGGSPSNLTVGPDGNLWFTETVYDASGLPSSGRVGRVTPSGVVSEYALAADLYPQSDLTVGPDGNLWFVGFVGFVRTADTAPGIFVGRVSPSGAISDSLVEGSQFTGSPGLVFVNPSPLTVGSDGNLWFTETKNERFSPTSSVPATGLAIERVNVAAFPTPQPLSPTITSLLRTGVRAQPTRLVLTFDAALTPSSAQNTRNYVIVRSGPRGRVRPHARPVPIRRAIYAAGSDTVTLTLRQRLPIAGYYRVTVRGGLTGANGALLDGSGQGQPGTDYSALLHKSGPVTPSAAGLGSMAHKSGNSTPVR